MMGRGRGLMRQSQRFITYGLIVSVLVGGAGGARGDARPGTAGAGRRPTFPYCQIVDRFPDPLHGAELTAIPPGDIAGAKRVGLGEMRVWSEFAYFRTYRGDIAFDAEGRFWWPTGDGGIHLPDSLAHLRLRGRWDLRGYNGLTYRLELEPGFYAEPSAFSDGFSLPASLTAIQSFTDRFSGFVGLRLRPSDRRVLDPAAGLRLSPVDELIFDLGYPDTRLWWRPSTDWAFLVGAQWNRLWEFEVDDARERLRYRETRLYGAARTALDRLWHLEVRLGVVSGREIGFKGEGDRELL